MGAFCLKIYRRTVGWVGTRRVLALFVKLLLPLLPEDITGTVSQQPEARNVFARPSGVECMPYGDSSNVGTDGSCRAR
jgi:hypothetical protein